MTSVRQRSAVLSLAVAGLVSGMIGVATTSAARASTFADAPALTLSETPRSVELVPLMLDNAPATQQAPATNAAAAEGALQVTVAEVMGNVQVRANENADWQPAKAGMVVDQGAEFRTGPRSSVRCTIPPDQSFTLDRLGVVKVQTAIKNGTKLKTDMLMKYGRTKYSVEAAGLEHEGTIASPSGTLAVRGTVVSMYDQPPFVPQATSYTGKAAFRDAVRTASVGSKGGKKSTLSVDKASAADTALANSVTDPRYANSRTNSEATYIASQIAPGGVTSFDPIANITVVRNSTPIANDATLAAHLPGELSFTARWFGNADVNLEVFRDPRDPMTALFDPKGFNATEFLYPGYGLNTTKSGGTIPFDDRGGPNGGTEVAFWKNAPVGVYGIGALLVSGNPVDLKVNVFLDGKKQSIFFIDSKGNFAKTKTLEMTLTSASQIGGPIVFIPALPLLEDTTPNEGDDGSSTGTGSTVTAAARGRTGRIHHFAPPANNASASTAYSGNQGTVTTVAQASAVKPKNAAASSKTPASTATPAANAARRR